MCGWPKAAWSTHHPEAMKALGETGGIGTRVKGSIDRCVGWLCPSCLKANSVAVADKQVRVAVFWSFDGAFYTGKVDKWDSVSGLHRIYYDDDDWEFVFLQQEVVIYSMNAATLQSFKACNTADAKVIIEHGELEIDLTSGNSDKRKHDDCDAEKSTKRIKS